MRFFIPSYRRADRCRTVRYLNSLGYSREQIHVSTQTEEDYRAYEAAYGSIAVVHYREAQNCAGNRNTLVGLMSEGEIGMFLDDDLYSLQRYVFSDGEKYGRLVDLDRDGLDALCSRAEEDIKSGVKLIGLAWNTNVMNIYRALSSGKAIDKTKTLSGASLFVINDDELMFDESLDCLDDTELCLRRIFNGDTVLRYNEYAMNKPQDTKEKGGCFDVYQSGKKIDVLKELDRRFYPLARHEKDWTGMRIRAGLR